MSDLRPDIAVYWPGGINIIDKAQKAVEHGLPQNMMECQRKSFRREPLETVNSIEGLDLPEQISLEVRDFGQRVERVAVAGDMLSGFRERPPLLGRVTSSSP
jgi:hypothetical protein